MTLVKVTPIFIRTRAQRARVMKMKRQLNNYQMIIGQGICEHIIVVCNMMQELIFAGYEGLGTHEAMYQSLLITFMLQDKELMSSIWESSSSNKTFDWLVCSFIRTHRRREVIRAMYPCNLPVDITRDIASRASEDIPYEVIHSLPRRARLIYR